MTATETLREILKTSRTVAVVGLSRSAHRPSHEVASFLQQAGYRVVPVRPGAGAILGEPVHESLEEASRVVGPLEIVNVFRRSDAVPELLGPLLAVRPRLVWMQVGVHHEPTAARLREQGIPVVMDRCLMADYPRILGA
jgi:predicted CoA-binding protein